jgi:hypothetical protein
VRVRAPQQAPPLLLQAQLRQQVLPLPPLLALLLRQQVQLWELLLQQRQPLGVLPSELSQSERSLLQQWFPWCQTPEQVRPVRPVRPVRQTKATIDILFNSAFGRYCF